MKKDKHKTTTTRLKKTKHLKERNDPLSTFLLSLLRGTERAETHDKVSNQFIQLLSYGKTRLSPLSPAELFLPDLSYLSFFPRQGEETKRGDRKRLKERLKKRLNERLKEETKGGD